ncbi:MAG: hypothetical protein ACK4MV_13585 [Beijerinckiaceae bacterium]
MDAKRIDLDAAEGFAAKPVTAELARRQLRMSLCVMGGIVAAALAVFATAEIAPVGATADYRASMTVQQPRFVQPMTAVNSADVTPPGG